MQVSVVFVKRDGGPERLVSEAELVFGEDAGPLAGLKLVGFTVWRGADAELYITFPSRAFGGGSERRFFDYVRSANGDTAGPKNLKTWIVEQYKAQQAAA
jgi:hypothetical protein